VIEGTILRAAPTTVLLVVGAFLAQDLSSAEPGSADGYEWVTRILSDSRSDRVAAAETLESSGDESLIPALVDAVFFTPKGARQEILGVLSSLTGEVHDGYYDWVEYVGAHSELEPAPGYLEWKLSLLVRIDPTYRTVLYPGAPTRIRLEEIVWGGVPMAGIPALDDPPTVSGSAARYLKKKEWVFGLVHGGQARAYPLRILSWHELLNDRLGGEPIALSFCTLCGSGIFYRTRTPNGASHRFDTSGLLYRSNKLMVDRRSRSLWSNLTGKPVVGRLAGTSIRLEVLPGTLTTWEAWLADNPETTVLDLQAIRDQMRPRYRYDYRPGAAERARRGVSFPVWLQSDVLERDRQVFTLRLAGRVKAYPVDRVLEVGVINDQIGGEAVVIVGDRAGGSVRAYRRGFLEFEDAGSGRLQDGESRRWVAKEEGLRSLDETELPQSLERLPGQVALWFGWYAFFPQTEVWQE